MLKATWRRLGSPAWLAIGLVFLLPTMAQAQLFPNRPIKRVRPPCSSEPPFNAQVRRDYFGYYPTCWSKFPEGWACPCPNPELPNLAESKRKIPFNQKRGSYGDDAGLGLDEENPDDPGMGAPANPAGDTQNIPLPNGGRSPFELDANPKPPGTTPTPDPFDTPAPTAPRPGTNSPASGGRPSTAAGGLEMPELPATTPSARYESPLKPGSMALMPDATLTSSDTSDLRPDLGMLPSTPASNSGNSMSLTAPTGQPTVGMPAPAQAPRRKGILGSLFGSKETRKR